MLREEEDAPGTRAGSDQRGMSTNKMQVKQKKANTYMIMYTYAPIYSCVNIHGHIYTH